MTNLDSIFKSRDITLPTKVHLVKAMVFPVIVYGCESWTVKKAERQRIDAFELCCWRRLLRVPWTARRPNQSILKETSSGISLDRMMLKLKTPTLWPPHAKNWLIGKDRDAGKDWWQEKWSTEDEMAEWHHWLDGHEFEWTLGVGDGQGGLVSCDSWGRRDSDTTEQLNWTECKRNQVKKLTQFWYSPDTGPCTHVLFAYVQHLIYSYQSPLTESSLHWCLPQILQLTSVQLWYHGNNQCQLSLLASALTRTS